MLYFIRRALFYLKFHEKKYYRKRAELIYKNHSRRTTRKNVKKGYVYFYTNKQREYIKIGRAVNPEQRLNQQKTSMPHGMKVLSVIKATDMVGLETTLHREFSNDRIPNKEWFKRTPKLELYIKTFEELKKQR